LVVAKVRERLAMGKRMIRKMDVERFKLNQLNLEEVKEQYQVTIKNKFAALENLEYNGDINKAWGNYLREQEFRPKRVSDFLNQSLISHGMTRNV
jgi:hypothetical protein